VKFYVEINSKLKRKRISVDGGKDKSVDLSKNELFRY